VDKLASVKLTVVVYLVYTDRVSLVPRGSCPSWSSNCLWRILRKSPTLQTKLILSSYSRCFHSHPLYQIYLYIHYIGRCPSRYLRYCPSLPIRCCPSCPIRCRSSSPIRRCSSRHLRPRCSSCPLRCRSSCPIRCCPSCPICRCCSSRPRCSSSCQE